MHFSPSAARDARLSRGLSQQQVADRAGVSIYTVRRTETGANEPGAGALGRIALALGVSVDSLFVHEADDPTSQADGGELVSART